MEGYELTAAHALAAPGAMPETVITGDMLESFLGFCDVAERSRITYRKSLRPFFRWISSHNITRPRYEDILAYKEELKQSKAASTVQAYITAVKLFFQWADIKGLYPDVSRHIKGARLNTAHKKDALTAAQVKDVLRIAGKDKSITGLRNKALLTVMFQGGLRCIEASRADVGDMGTKGGIPVLYIQGKGREEKADYVKLLPQTEAAIRAYLAERGAEAGEPLFTSDSNNSKGGRLSTNGISLIIKAAFKAAGLSSSRLTAHSTRHTAVTLAIEAGDTPEEAAQFARHKNVATTYIYIHEHDRLTNPTEERIGSLIF